MKRRIAMKFSALVMTACLLLSTLVMGALADTNPTNAVGDDGTFKVLLIGNSMSDDAADSGYSDTSKLWEILKSMVGENTNVVVGLMWSGGKTLAWHATVAEYGMTDGQHYVFAYIEDGKNWSYIGGIDITAKALSYTDWDAVVLQPYSHEIKRGKSTYANEERSDFINLADSVPYMLDHVATNAPGADIYLYQPWSDANAYGAIPVFDAERETYEKICKYIRLAESYTGPKTGASFKATIPAGAAVQAARGTYLAKLNFNRDAQNIDLSTDPQFGLQRDGVHISLSIGRYIVGLTFAEVLIPKTERVEGYTLPSMRPSAVVGEMPEEYHEIARLAVDAALESAKLTGDKKFNVKCLTGLENSPIDEVIAEIDRSTFTLKAVATAEELEALWEESIFDGTTYDIIPDITLNGTYAPPAPGETATVTATLFFRHGYLTGETIVTAEVSNGIDNPFFDVSTDDWFYDDVLWAYCTGLMKGVSEVRFAPDDDMSRAMLVTVLWRSEGLPEPENSPFFTDLKDDWYMKAVAWAYENEIVKGKSKTEFDPDGMITREQIAAIFYRYADYKSYDISASADLSTYPDAGNISEYAVGALSWANAEGLINGTNDYGRLLLDPLGSATRAQSAAIFNRFLERY